MKKSCSLTLAVISFVLVLDCAVWAENGVFEYPYYLLDAYNPDEDCWKGMDVNGRWPVPVVLEELLVGSPPSKESGVTIPIDHWIELKFRGKLVDGPGDDVFLVERDAVGEQALVFITDGCGQEYLLGLAAVPDNGGYGLTEIGFDIAGTSLPFVPSAIRVLGIDLRGGSPGFDLAYVRARTYPNCGLSACNPSPADGVKNVPIDAVLNWSPGCSAEKHIVYFGTTLADVGENAIPVSNPTQPQDANSFHPTGLKLGRTYYWRVDEVNDADANCPWTGNLWRFATADYFVVDDFESYYISTIYETWTSGGSGWLSLSSQSHLAHKCQYSMEFHYDYDPVLNSEATMIFRPPQNWASAGVKSLELFFHGKANNDVNAQMYMIIGDGNTNEIVPYAGDANDISSESWQSWRVDLQNLDVNLSNIEHITIGFYFDTSEPPYLGTGTVFFDDIRLYPSRCLEENRPDADFNDDCIVGFEDLQEMAYSWLDRGYNIYPVAAPNAPIAWYKFDGNTNDSAGSAYGHLYGNQVYVTGVFGQAISFDGYENSVLVTDVKNLFSNVRAGITIAFWQYGKDSPHYTDTLFCSNYVDGVYSPAIAINLGCWKSPGKYNWDCGWPWSFDSRLSGKHRYKNEWSGRWNHWAFTKDIHTGNLEIFLNGILFDSRTGSNSPISGITSFEIGSGWYGGYDGLIDDFIIYDYALSQPEIAYAATNGTGIFDQPLIYPTDLNNDNIINFIDFTILANNWLTKQLWP